MLQDVLAGILDVHSDAGKLFQKNFADQAGVAAGSAGGDDELRAIAEGVENRLPKVGAEPAIDGVPVKGGGDRGGLLADFREHVVLMQRRFGGWVGGRVHGSPMMPRK